MALITYPASAVRLGDARVRKSRFLLPQPCGRAGTLRLNQSLPPSSPLACCGRVDLSFVEGPAVAEPVDGPSSPERLVALYADINRALSGNEEGLDTIHAVTRLAVVAVPGVEQASISEGSNGKFRTLASTGAIAMAGDRIQYEMETGPCVDAIVDDAVFRSNDIVTDTRWPKVGTRIHAETGTTSMMSIRLFMEGDDRIAGLNLYSTQSDAFDDDAQIIATVLATHSATALLAAAARERVANLQRALISNRRIGMAMGVLMSSHKLIEDDAFTLLRIASQNTNRKLADVADDVITTGMLELPNAAPLRRPSRTRPAPPADTP
jgi:ANTAR domain-containing protein/GAF domain-containing protein